ncbi:uncharacterized protein SPPG_05671 [Spizellomyces punctatus DAOM BR117]|uniref:Alpha-mannosidase n=1 Tax=Spizellomyces punctatus (strain DAOM BR117) TaxID=645134 RepID=A0A0L0HD56_SPIPD|nr:uncharacterized protein SPPG_05671 [Spizellomyces punctatus DAOM BR117]KNC99430.1 hypothetical protein SPPG_05671 [Spizellomyces punctatus DAOM BR117]|eukprot:XP_016607470.1 hypothetical protein SPPG_05671 [Spizellomyces punctatus DAOM BR117]
MKQSSSSLRTSDLNGMQKHRRITIERLEKYLQNGQFSDVNLHATLVKERNQEAVNLQVFSVPNGRRIPFADAIQGSYQPTQVGESFGPTWSTHWFKVTITIPESYAGQAVVFIFDPSCEALVWSTKGQLLIGITGDKNVDRHVDYRLTKSAKGGEQFELYVEVACNGMFGAGIGGNGSINPPEEDRYYRLTTAEIIVPNTDAFDLLWDMEVLLGMVKELPENTQASCDALYTANQIVNTVFHDDLSSIKKAKEISREFFEKRSHTGYSQHVVTAIGNCHIDTAWLWPYDETKRKAARSWSTQVFRLMENYPEYVFTASQAQQFEWTEQLYPELFERIKEHAKTGNFIPIGVAQTWVEMDCNLPSGEAFCRQFLYGQRYFEEKFGERCTVFWLPDTFGYVLLLLPGLKYFFTQKLSWNNINKFPHTTFMWTGLDGTSVLTHFSPADTYTAQASVRDVVFAVHNNKDKPYSNQSLLVYGNGDGGGGPLIPMIERLRRMQNVEGLPATVKFGSPNTFYEELEQTSRDLVSWKGELYFELHRGTYTSQALTKKYNRQTELLLRDIEILSSLCVATGVSDFKYPKTELDRLWKLVLLNQFHDVLPGSSIEIVYHDALKFYADVVESGTKLRNEALEALIGRQRTSTKGPATVFNPTSWTRPRQVIELDTETANVDVSILQQTSADGRKALVILEEVPAYALKTVQMGYKPSDFVPVTGISTVVKFDTSSGEKTIVENAFIKVVFNQHGRIESLYDKKEGRETIAPQYLANVFKLYEDIPLYWDAWDVEVYHLEKGGEVAPGTLSVAETGPLRAVLKVSQPITKQSKLVQTIIVTATSSMVEFDTWVDWHENRRILKVEFPVDIANDFATYETQFGFIRRPTHYNNSWDMARFEVCGHKFVDYSEHGYGVTLLNDCKYGFAVHGNVIRMSLLRSPKAPDLHCDMGEHRFRYALYPHRGGFNESNVVQAGYEFNVPLLIRSVSSTFSASIETQFFTVDTSNVVLDTIKQAEDAKDKDIVLRLYEAYGGRGRARVKSTLPIKKAFLCNILEDVTEEVKRDDEGALLLEYTPFKVLSIRIAVD